MMAGTIFLLKESLGSIINARLCKNTADTVISTIKKICSSPGYNHCSLPSISTSSNPSSDGQPSLLEVYLVPLCSLWSGCPDLTSSVLLSDDNISIAQLLSERRGYAVLVVPKDKISNRENEPEDITVVKENLSRKRCLESYDTSVRSQQEFPALEAVGSSLGSQLSGGGLPGVRGQERHGRQSAVGVTHQRVGSVNKEEDGWTVERVSETEFEVEKDGGEGSTKMTNRQTIIPGLESLLTLRSSCSEEHQATPLAVERDRQEKVESECVLVGVELLEQNERIRLEHAPPKRGTSSPKQLKHTSPPTPLDRYSQSRRIEIMVDSSSDEDLSCIMIAAPHKVSSPLLPVCKSRTTSSECHSCPGTPKDVILISGSEDEPVKHSRGVGGWTKKETERYGKPLSSSPEDSLGCAAPSPSSSLPSMASNPLKPLEESFDEGIVMEESVSSDLDDVMVVGVDGEVKIWDAQIVSVLKAELQRSPLSHWNVPRAMRRLRRVFGEAVTSKESLVQERLQELLSSQRWLLPPTPTASFECCGMVITQGDLNTLLPGRWLNDQVINCYMRLLVESFGRKRIHVVSTFFYTKLRTTGYKGVEKWLKNIDLLHLRLLLVPVHLGQHWCLTAVDFRRKRIEYFDSLGGRNRRCLKRLLVFLLKCAQQRGCTMKNGWKRGYPKGIPHQSNFCDCGVFACQFARWLCSSQFELRSKIPFHQKHMPLIRTTMAHELRTGKLVQYKL